MGVPVESTKNRIRFAPRLSSIQASPTLQVMNKANELIAKGIDIVDFGPGEPDFPTPSAISTAAKKAIDDGFTKYTNALGCLDLRKAIAVAYRKRYGIEVGPENVIAGTGGKQELFNLMLALVTEGDEIIIPSPYWVSFPDQVTFAGGTPVFAHTRAAEGFRPSFRAIERIATEKTRGMIINSPANPTGAVIPEGELRKLVELCHARGWFLVFDETYEFFLYDGVQHASPAKWFNEFPETVIVVNSMSKTYSMTGWRLGYAVADAEIVSGLGKIQSHSTSNPSSISQFAAIEALQSGDGEIRKMLDAYIERRRWLVPALNAIPGIECRLPDGAFYVFPKVSQLYGKAGITDSTTFAAYLLNEARVAVVPGSAFGADDYVRISYATSLPRIQEGVARIAAAVDKLNG